ncbi:MAG: phosphatase PAP2 family protein [Deltaproteobacteria bacterium]|nr:phosphatase PAP2 family protein [Deltaproteobacteria bacterium]
MAGAGFLALFLLFSLFVEIWKLNGFDVGATKSIQAVIPRILDVPLSFFSLFGAFEVTSAILLILIWRVRELRPYWVFLILGFGVLVGVETFSKHFLGKIRPPAIYYRYSLPIFFPTSRVESKYAYPSGHMGRTTFLLVVFWYLVGTRIKMGRRKRYYFGLVGVGLLMAISRVYLGEHWLTDVVGGSLLGIGVGLVSFQAFSVFGSYLKFLKFPLDS